MPLIIPDSWGSTPIREANDCHEPAGSPKGGQFCSKGGGASWDGMSDVVGPLDGLEAAVASAGAVKPTPEDELPSATTLDDADPNPATFSTGEVRDNPLLMRALGEGESDISRDDGGVSVSYVGQYTDPESGEEFKAIWKPEAGAAWTNGDIRRNQGDDEFDGDDEEEFDQQAEIQKILDNNEIDASEEWNTRRDAYKSNAEDAFSNLLPATWDKVVTSMGLLMVGEDQAEYIDAYDAVLEEVKTLYAEGFDEEDGTLLPRKSEEVLRGMAERIKQAAKANGTPLVVTALPEFDEDLAWGQSTYYNDNDGYDNWLNDYGSDWENARMDSLLQQRLDAWNDARADRENNDGGLIRDGINNRDFPHHERDVAAFEVDRMLGIGLTPYTTTTTEYGTDHDGIGSVQAWTKTTQRDYAEALAGTTRGRDQILRGIVLDLIIGNADRHGGNYIADAFTQRLFTIDNNLTFTEGTMLRSVLPTIVHDNRERNWNLNERTRRTLVERMDRTDWKSWANKYQMSNSERGQFFRRLSLVRSLLDTPGGIYEYAKGINHEWFDAFQHGTIDPVRRPGWS
jgi:hypothetical protein